MKVDYVDHMGSDLTVVNAARVSFNKASDWDWDHPRHLTDGAPLKESDEKLINYLAIHGHWTPFSHPQITLRMKAPIIIRTQCFKHKQGFTENEVSRRYVDDAPEFFRPAKWRGKPKNSKQGSSDEEITQVYEYTMENGTPVFSHPDVHYERFLDLAQDLYNELIIEGVAPEQARMVLPQAMYTEWYWTGSLAAYARFYKQRSDSHAQMEIQELAKMVGDIIRPIFPVSWEALTIA